jgi:hypothetical protein
MITITWDAAVLVLNKWALDKTDVQFARIAGIHPERQAFEAMPGESIRILSVSSEEGTIKIEVHGKTVPVDLRGATIEYEHESANPYDEKLHNTQSRRLEFTFPEGEKWNFG